MSINYPAWEGFTGGEWQDEIDPAEFIRRLLNDACKGNNIYYAIFSMGFGMTQGKSKR